MGYKIALLNLGLSYSAFFKCMPPPMTLPQAFTPAINGTYFATSFLVLATAPPLYLLISNANPLDVILNCALRLQSAVLLAHILHTVICELLLRAKQS